MGRSGSHGDRAGADCYIGRVNEGLANRLDLPLPAAQSTGGTRATRALSPSEATAVMGLISIHARTIKLHDIEMRLRALECAKKEAQPLFAVFAPAWIASPRL
jgi:hypothetical protein